MNLKQHHLFLYHCLDHLNAECQHFSAFKAYYESGVFLASMQMFFLRQAHA